MNLVAKNIETPDELRTLPNGSAKGSVVHVGGHTVIHGAVQPGWRWSNDLRPLVGTTSCEFPHNGIALSGCLHVEMDDGTALDIKQGDVYYIPPGHDAWVVGDEPYVSVDWAPNNEDFAKPKS